MHRFRQIDCRRYFSYDTKTWYRDETHDVLKVEIEYFNTIKCNIAKTIKGFIIKKYLKLRKHLILLSDVINAHHVWAS